jgi:hypothetical protein
MKHIAPTLLSSIFSRSDAAAKGHAADAPRLHD